MSEAEYQPTSLFLAEEQPHLDAFEAAAAEVRSINVEGANFEAKPVDDEDDGFRQRGLGRLSLDQTKAFTQMLTAAEQINYDELMQRTETTARWHERASGERAMLGQAYIAQTEEIRRKAADYINALPRAVDDFVDEADKQIAQIDRQQLDRAQNEERCAERVAAKLGEALRVAGCLPIPNYVPSEQRVAIYNALQTPAGAVEPEAESPEIVQVDLFPVDPATLTKAEFVERVQKKFPEERRADASAFLALILAEDPGRAFTYQDLGQLMYPDENSKVAATRVAALISNLRKGEVQIISNTLTEQHYPPLTLQTGERVRYYKSTGIKVGQKRTVFRAVALPDEPARPLHDDGTTDINWRNVEASPAPDDPNTQASLL